MATASADVDRLQRRLTFGGHGMEFPYNIVADLSRVTRALYRLQAVLTTAEKQPFEASREPGLRKIKQNVYDVEDILDELEDGSSRPQGSSRGRKFFLPGPSNLWSQVVFLLSSNHSVLNCRMVKKMKKIRKSLDHATERSFMFALLHHRADGDQNCHQYVFDETAIIGRDTDKENLRALLLSKSEENFSIIPIVGLGGLGKTALTQLIFNDKDVTYNFDLRVWINLNMSYNLNSIASAIISKANRKEESNSKVDEEIEDNPQIIMNCLREVLYDKRCLIVLDGLWSQDEGQLLHLKKMLGSTENTKIIVTTSSENVAKLMQTVQPYKLGPLPEENCWKIFSQIVFGVGDNSDLTRIGKQIVNRCEGIPAVVHSLGSLVRDKGMNVWNDEKQELWKLEREFPFQINMFSSIKQIYCSMPSALKSCLCYLSMFPEGSDILMENLIRQWDALGILGSAHGSLPVYSQGKKYTQELLSVFFLEAPNKSSGSGLNYSSISKVILNMHNLVHEFARYVTSHDLYILDGERKSNDGTEIRTSRYAVLTGCNDQSEIRKVLLTNVRAICLKDCGGAKLIEKLFSALKHLRVLDLSRCSFLELPSSICQLTHLRYIDISSSAIQSLPDQMSLLQNLEALDLSETCIQALPDFVGSFEKLKYLNLQGCPELHYIPSKLDFRSLQHLNLSCCPAAHQLLESISGFQELRFLDISNCTELQTLPESFGRLTNLEDLILSKCTRLKKLPESFGELCFLQFLNISNCCELEEMPASLGRLASLEVLILSGCCRIRNLPQSLIDIAFLRILDLAGCVDLHIHLEMLPNNNLENLSVDGCRKIYVMPGWALNFPKLHPECVQTCNQQIRRLITEKQVCPSSHDEVEISKELNVPVHDEIEEAMASQSWQQAGNYECTTKEVFVDSCAHTSHNIPWNRTTPTGDLQPAAVVGASGGSACTGPAPAAPVPRRRRRCRSQLHEPHGRRTGEVRQPRKLQSAGSNSCCTGEFCFACWPRRKLQKHFSDVPAKEDPDVHLGKLKKFSLRELQVATDNFSNKYILGRGEFGKVYKGRLADDSLVAIKRQKEQRTPGAGELQFQAEVDVLSTVEHRNILRLHGFCMTQKERLLVYPYMVNGSVASRLRERQPSEPPLDWETRWRIALGSARALSYLHDNCDPKIIHCDVKASNILLDEDFEAVVGDFGLAKVMHYKDTDVTTGVHGTIGHIAPEYVSTGKASERTDVFSYGIMLLELITGYRPFDLARLAKDDDLMLLDWVKELFKEKKLELIADPDLGNYYEVEVESLVQIALLCTQRNPIERPKMSEVVTMLEGGGGGLAERWEEWLKVADDQDEIDSHHTADCIVDSAEKLRSEELSGPR